MAILQSYAIAVVVSNDDDKEHRGGIVVKCPQLWSSNEPSGDLIYPEDQERGFFNMPEVGDVVILKWDENDTMNDFSIRETFMIKPNLRWTHAQLSPAGSKNTISEVFKENYPNRRGFVSRKGHAIFFDDSSDEKKQIVGLIHRMGHGVVLHPDGSITATATDGSTVQLLTKDKVVILRQAGGATVELSPSGLQIVSPDGSFISLKDGFGQLVAQGQWSVIGALINLSAASVILGSGADGPSGSPIARATELNDFLTSLVGWLGRLQSPPGVTGGPLLLDGASPVNTPLGSPPAIPDFSADSRVK